MENISSLLKKKASQAIFDAFGEQLPKEQLEAEVLPCHQENFGHYQCNSALRLAKLLKENPRKVAETICENLKEKDLFEKVEIAGPGFINLTLTPAFLSSELQKVLADAHLGVPLPEEKQKIIVEFSSPNIAKELHVGHLRSTIIGDCIANVFEFLDQDVLRLNHIGDWGTQFGMLIAFLREFHPRVLSGEDETDLTSLMEWYKAAKNLFDKDADFKKRAQMQVVQLQGGEESSIKSWRMICEISRNAFNQIYNLLDVHILERGESFYNPQLPNTVEDLEQKGLITISDGAKCIYVEGFKNRDGNPLPVMVQKSDGGYNYDTTDIAAFNQRVSGEKADRIIVVTDLGQSLHFQMVYDVVVRAGYLDPKKVSFDHVTFGLVLGENGKKFKTREGKTEKLIDLLNEAVHHAKQILSDRLPCINKEELDTLAKTLGIGAVKYADLSSHRQKDYRFSYDKMLKLEGNTVAFLEYAFVRIQGILRKTQADTEKVLKENQIHLSHASEIALGLHLRRFGETIDMVTKDLLPNRLTDYLYELAEKFNAFFRDCRVEGTDEEGSRLVLCILTARILKQGLKLLGINTMSRM